MSLLSDFSALNEKEIFFFYVTDLCMSMDFLETLKYVYVYYGI